MVLRDTNNAREPFTPEQIAAARAAVKAKPNDAKLVATERDETDPSGHRISAGDLAWRTLGAPRYDGPPDASSVAYRSVHWTCRSCGQRKGWDELLGSPKDG